MKTEAQWIETIKKRMDELNITQNDLACLLGMTQGNIGHYLRGRRDPSVSTFIEIISILNLLDKPLSKILNFDVDQLSPENFLQIMASKCPILSWEEAIEWPKNKEELEKKSRELLSNQLNLGANCYALKVQDDAMFDNAKAPTFPEGTFIIVDPNKEYKLGNYVIVSQKGSSELIFRRYVKLAGTNKFILEALNNKPKYPLIDFKKDMHICGVVVAFVGSVI